MSDNQQVPFGSGMFQGQAKFVDYAHMNQQDVQMNTLDEPVLDTLRYQYDTLQIIICNNSKNEGDLRKKTKKLGFMGTITLIFVASYDFRYQFQSIMYCLNKFNFLADAIFGTIFIIMWGGSAVITVNAKLLGGQVSFFQSVCVLGYCVFPINVAAVLITFLQSYLGFFLRLIIVGVAFLWSTFSSLSFMSSMMNEEKKVISVYPIFLFYLFLSWFCIFI
ncbi:unnamed protein product [Paramecium sonneborni]|uniref:Protein YIPF n=1 Tax=Paramecium sonneborni TaxID=65129 RepID=A0A8S1MQ70_9CILI|nr:unnamed protein product [Paramecium sonneborni]